MPAIKLYLPYGTFGNASDRKREWYSPYAEIILHWFVVGREQPLAPYPSLILGYSRLTPASRTTAERTVDEFFSEPEFHLLRDYLRTRHNKDVRTAVLCAPVPSLHPDPNTRTGLMRPFCPAASPHVDIVYASAATSATSDESDEEMDDAEPAAVAIEMASMPQAVAPMSRPATEAGFCRLSEEEGYNLPFTVWGYYSATARPERGAEVPSETTVPQPFTPGAAVRTFPTRTPALRVPK